MMIYILHISLLLKHTHTHCRMINEIQMRKRKFICEGKYSQIKQEFHSIATINFMFQAATLQDKLNTFPLALEIMINLIVLDKTQLVNDNTDQPFPVCMKCACLRQELCLWDCVALYWCDRLLVAILTFIEEVSSRIYFTAK